MAKTPKTPGSAPAKAGKAAKPDRATRKAARSARLSQLRSAFTLTKQNDPRLVLWMAVAFLVPVVLMVALGLVVGGVVFFAVIGVLLGFVAAVSVFGRRAQKAAYAQVSGQPGAAAAVVDNLRGDWRVTPAVQFNRNQDLVHRVIGRPGVILLAEGSPRGARELLGVEVKRVRRVLGDTPLYDIVIGEGEGEVPVDKLAKHLMRLPRNLKPAGVDAADKRLKAIGGAAMPIPKGPMPRSIPRGKVR